MFLLLSIILLNFEDFNGRRRRILDRNSAHPQRGSVLAEIVALSLRVTLSAVLVSCLIGLPLGAALALSRFPGRGAVIIVFNALMGLPPVVAGLVVYLLLSRSGPLGALSLLFTPTAMIIAQTILILPIIVSLTRSVIEDLWREYEEQLRSLGSSATRAIPTLLWDGRFSLVTVILRGMSFNLGAGTRSVIMGPNGAGKSLTLRLCHGLLRPTAGRIEWAAAPGDGRQHAMVFQRPVMLRRSARANMIHALSLAGIAGRERAVRADEALDRFGLAGLAARPARLLSGGEQQRLAIARAWSLRPQVLFLDEPTSSLDPAATKAIEEMIAAIHGEGVKIVMTTHDLGQARRVADEVLFLHHGQLLEHTPAGQFFEQPQTEEARAFVRGELLW
jgi:tungstate transport system ATP-binding protein